MNSVVGLPADQGSVGPSDAAYLRCASYQRLISAMPISKSIVSDHRGQIEAQPNAIRGATFRVWLPAVELAPSSRAIPKKKKVSPP